ncbi:hypothetical protein JOF56_003073 [Kibdelosporangium banguiense]|uniref:Uncharacterized protein n=2 Tax=Kibdelosporangium banguiense TaxID=1365924 RepID=A0ABS4TFP2_9PSEU|nr:hypothetical protein [Kibdelosporangium banguiense]
MYVFPVMFEVTDISVPAMPAAAHVVTLPATAVALGSPDIGGSLGCAAAATAALLSDTPTVTASAVTARWT